MTTRGRKRGRRPAVPSQNKIVRAVFNAAESLGISDRQMVEQFAEQVVVRLERSQPLPGMEHLVDEEIGPMVENASIFPERVNLHVVQISSADEVIMRTWERGSGITLACGTGAAAVCVAGVLTGRTRRDVLVHLPGGDLRIEWRESDNHVFMTGPATEVFEGEWIGAKE